MVEKSKSDGIAFSGNYDDVIAVSSSRDKQCKSPSNFKLATILYLEAHPTRPYLPKGKPITAKGATNMFATGYVCNVFPN